MSESSKRESEERALEALIVSQIWQVREPEKVVDLPELSIDERTVMNSLGTDFVRRLWNNLPDEASDLPFDLDSVSECIFDEALAGMNRADDMDEETRKKIEERRKEVLERLRKKRLDEKQNDA
jgi:hypothetical protein